MLLENTSVGVIAFGLKEKGSKPVVVIPGINFVEEKAWGQMEKNPTTKEWMESGRLVAHSGATKAEKEKAKKALPDGVFVHHDFLGMDESEVVHLVKKTLFLPLLNRWLDGENRPKVTRALHEQIDKAGPTAVKKDS